MNKLELLAPAGSFDVMKACISAGADAVYMGRSRFSARAYADNAEGDAYEDAIDYAHLRGVRLFLPVNILFKEKELPELFELLAPLYAHGLDGVIVQDMGAVMYIREKFPELPVHISTQATVVGKGCAEIWKRFGVTRVVPARELSLKDIREIADTGLEVECFIHGALCYCYSGQCLYSSVVGGRSGNRGRCAQPCRMEYSLKEGKQYLNKKDERYLLSLKDLNTLALLPELVNAGITSYKIEGRMKKAEYAAGVTSIYRKYMDRILKNPDAPYKVSTEDEARLYDLFHRKDFTNGYYKRHNGREMLTLEASDFREHDDAFMAEIRENYIRKEKKTPVEAYYEFYEGQPYKIHLKTELYGRVYEIESLSEEGLVAEAARSRVSTEADVLKQLSKTGDTAFSMEKISGQLQDGLFLPVSSLNEFRRKALKELEEEILDSFRRN